MIDWKNLTQLPLRRQRAGDERERLATASFRKKAAVHKGRCHFHAYQRRQQIAAKKIENEKAKAAKIVARRRALEAVRAYWRGERDNHP